MISQMFEHQGADVKRKEMRSRLISRIYLCRTNPFGKFHPNFFSHLLCFFFFAGKGSRPDDRYRYYIYEKSQLFALNWVAEPCTRIFRPLSPRNETPLFLEKDLPTVRLVPLIAVDLSVVTGRIMSGQHDVDFTSEVYTHDALSYFHYPFGDEVDEFDTRLKISPISKPIASKLILEMPPFGIMKPKKICDPPQKMLCSKPQILR